MKVIWTTSFPRPLRNRFFFVLGFSFCAAESLTLRTTSEKTHQETPATQANQINTWTFSSVLLLRT